MTFDMVVLIVCAVLIFCAVLIVSLAACLCVIAVRTHRMLMWFNRAGQSMAQHELAKAELDVRYKQAEAAKAQAEADAERARADMTRSNANGRSGYFAGGVQRTIGVDEN